MQDGNRYKCQIKLLRSDNIGPARVPIAAKKYRIGSLKCPVCKAVLGEQAEIPFEKKSTRIFAQVVAEGIAPVEANLIYTLDQGNNWFRLPMVREEDYFAADLPPMPQKIVIAYFLEATDVNGRKYH